MTPVYLDYNATTPVAPEVAEAMLPWLTGHFGNPSSAHVFGQRAAEAVAAARNEVAELIGAAPGEIVFTSGATEANNLAVLGVAQALAGQKHHLAVSAIEHPSVLAPAFHLQEQGWGLSIVPVDTFGLVNLQAMAAASRPDTALVSVMHANNEVGTVQPIADIARIVKRTGALLHVDAAQSVGKMPVNVCDLDTDLLTLAGHKFYAPKGIGALYVRAGTPISPLLFGAGQEHGLRPGTESVPLIVALGAAARLARERLKDAAPRLAARRDQLHDLLAAAIPGLQLNGHHEYRLPNTLHVSFPGVGGKALLVACDKEVAASAGSACHAHGDAVSGVLAAMGCDTTRAMGAVRLSVGVDTTEADIGVAARAFVRAYRALAGSSQLSAAEYWETVYRSKQDTELSWYQPRLDSSLSWIGRLLDGDHDAAIIDVGAGQSTLGDDLLTAGFSDLTLVDLSPSALAKVQQRLGVQGEKVVFVDGDIARLALPERHFRLWHDRAVFHFLTSPEERERYAKQAAASLVPGGYAVMTVFAKDGPSQCSQLDVENYDAETLAAAMGDEFELIASNPENHVTPAGKVQHFLCVVFRRRA